MLVTTSYTNRSLLRDPLKREICTDPSLNRKIKSGRAYNALTNLPGKHGEQIWNLIKTRLMGNPALTEPKFVREAGARFLANISIHRCSGALSQKKLASLKNRRGRLFTKY